jgi:hypothetical protein
MKLVMHSFHAIPDVLTKWHTQFQYILEIVPFLSSIQF